MNNNLVEKYKNSLIGLVAASFLAFFIFGFSDVLKGTAIPEIIHTGNISYNTGGALIGAIYVGFFSGALISVALLKKLRAPVLVSAAAVLISAGLVFFSFSQSVILMFISAFLMGTGGGLIDVTAVLTIRMITEKSKIGGRFNLLTFFHGLGAILAPFFAGFILIKFSDWHKIYFFAGTAILLITIFIIFVIRRGLPRYPDESSEQISIKVNSKVLILGGLIMLYMAIEIGISGWIVEYGKTIVGLGMQKALFYLSLFFILITAGRFLSSLYVDALGLSLAVLINYAGVLILITLGLIFNGMSILIPISGIFMASIFPTTVALISNELGGSNIRIMGVFFATGGIGGIAGPWLIGLISKYFSLQTGFSLLAVFSLSAVILGAFYHKLGRGEAS